jgi:hypothetical protein
VLRVIAHTLNAEGQVPNRVMAISRLSTRLANTSDYKGALGVATESVTGTAMRCVAARGPARGLE